MSAPLPRREQWRPIVLGHPAEVRAREQTSRGLEPAAAGPDANRPDVTPTPRPSSPRRHARRRLDVTPVVAPTSRPSSPRRHARRRPDVTPVVAPTSRPSSPRRHARRRLDVTPVVAPTSRPSSPRRHVTSDVLTTRLTSRRRGRRSLTPGYHQLRTESANAAPAAPSTHGSRRALPVTPAQ
ncbi:hypothetical protein JYU34_020195 [Plutella xylostella]|uniref:Uncharacterized protein n=1 Tax=Plutella xylostella TaxID=51655 RepID=A0ABQ7PTY4_PLUXY|nr:hypothetical protein JYU34_020195 [Plutella xylostella]